MSVPDIAPQLSPDVAYWAEMAEALAYRDSYAAAAATAGNPCGARFEVVGGATALAMTVLDMSFFNRTLGLGTAQPATREDIRAIATFYDGLGLAQVVIPLAPVVEPTELATWVEEAGFVPGHRWVKMVHDLGEIGEADPSLRIEAVGLEHAAAFARVSLTAFEMPMAMAPWVTAVVGRPGWTAYLGYEGDTPVSTGALHVTEGVAWLGYGSTLEKWRGRGWQTAMFRRRLRDARAAGCRLAFTETGEETEQDPVNHSYRNMLKTGFRLAYARRNHVRGSVADD